MLTSGENSSEEVWKEVKGLLGAFPLPWLTVWASSLPRPSALTVASCSVPSGEEP